ncbi:MAG: hypothetical protein SGARI_006878 [Bacillariaceae sp.]
MNEANGTYFEATACRAHIDYGSWNGMIHRHGDMCGADFRGETFKTGRIVAKVGSEDITADNPLFFRTIGSVLNAVDELPEDMPPGHQCMKAGYICFNLFFPNDEPVSVDVCIGLWFRPQKDDDDSRMPSEIAEEIRKIAPKAAEDDKEKEEEEGAEETEELESDGLTSEMTSPTRVAAAAATVVQHNLDTIVGEETQKPAAKKPRLDNNEGGGKRGRGGGKKKQS